MCWLKNIVSLRNPEKTQPIPVLLEREEGTPRSTESNRTGKPDQDSHNSAEDAVKKALNQTRPGTESTGPGQLPLRAAKRRRMKKRREKDSGEEEEQRRPRTTAK